jgi:hypothetical protein
MKEYTYYAFISYAHKDEKHAVWLQKSLENYRIPVKLRKTHGSDIPKHVRPVFRDKTDLRPGNLEKSLASELDDSRYLIVICSPAAKHSTWVNQEIEHFRQTGRTDNVIPLIVDCPQTTTVTDCYPDALDKSVLSISLEEFGKTKTLLHVLSRILDIRFDSLYERHKKARNRKSVLIALLSLIMLFVLSFPTREYIEIEKQQQALTNAVSSARHIISSLENSQSPIIEEGIKNLDNTWSADGNSENNVIYPLERRRVNSKLYTGGIRKELAESFTADELHPGGEEAFREQISLLNSQNESSTQSVISSAKSIIQHKKNVLDELSAIDESKSLEEARRHLGYLETELNMARLYGLDLFWQLHQTLKPYDEEGYPEVQKALSLAKSVPFERQSLLDKLDEGLKHKARLVNRAKRETETLTQQLSDGYNKIRAKCQLSPNNSPEFVWGKMIRLLTVGLQTEALGHLTYYEEMMINKGENPAQYTTPVRIFIKQYLHKTHEGGVVIMGFEGNRQHSVLKVGDIITAINKQTVILADDYITKRKKSEGQPVLTIYRYNKQQKEFEQISATLAPGNPKIGMLDLVEKL